MNLRTIGPLFLLASLVSCGERSIPVDPASAARRASWTADAARAELASRVAAEAKVLAVVVDEPVGGALSSLGLFADGTLKLLSSTGAGLEAGPDKLSAETQRRIREICADAARLRPAFSGDAAREAPLPRTLRITLLLRDGVVSAEESQTAMQDGSSPLASLTAPYLEMMKSASTLHRAGVR
jgi:hypothetical protein